MHESASEYEMQKKMQLISLMLFTITAELYLILLCNNILVGPQLFNCFCAAGKYIDHQFKKEVFVLLFAAIDI